MRVVATLLRRGVQFGGKRQIDRVGPLRPAKGQAGDVVVALESQVFVSHELSAVQVTGGERCACSNIVDGIVNGVRHVTVILLGHGSSLFDKYVVDGAVNGVGYSARGGSRLFRKLQSGFVQNYALVMGGGIVLIAAVYLFTKP